MLGLALFCALDFGLAGLGESLNGLVLVLFSLFGRLQASLAGSFLPLLQHLGRQLLLLVAHGELEKGLDLLLVQQRFLLKETEKLADEQRAKFIRFLKNEVCNDYKIVSDDYARNYD